MYFADVKVCVHLKHPEVHKGTAQWLLGWHYTMNCHVPCE